MIHPINLPEELLIVNRRHNFFKNIKNNLKK